MIIDATFWVAVSFVIFILIIFYFKVPQKIDQNLLASISNIKQQIESSEKLKEEAKNLLGDNERKLSLSKKEIELMIQNANELSEKKILSTTKEFHRLMENRKKNAEQKIKQLKDQAIKDIQNTSIELAIISVEKLIKNSIDKSKLDKIYSESIEETKLALQKKSS
mgnify:CR=1 FL=1|tara:strand:- start:434 stop:931 length:498 start_codon:yes stop_codon:yes gene_type:complete